MAIVPLSGEMEKDMRLNIPKTDLYSKQSLEMDKIAVLIGKNGSGKSRILQSIFKHKLKTGHPRGMKVVCFSSGQNERYSKIYDERLRKGLNPNCAYYDKASSKPFVFLAAALKPDGLVCKYLQDKENGYVSDSNGMSGLEMVCKFKAGTKYSDNIKSELFESIAGTKIPEKNIFMVNALNNFITEIFGDQFKNTHEFPEGEIVIAADRLQKIRFSIPDQLIAEYDLGSEKGGVQGNDFDRAVDFFLQALFDDNFIERDSIKLYFRRKGVEMDDLSDGEYQILFVYALIDLFDSINTLFLIDEPDTHLHHESIEKVWSALQEIDGFVLAATHLIDSMIANRIQDLFLVVKGEIIQELTRESLIDRLKVRSLIRHFVFELYGMSENMVIIDDKCDWDIFIELARQKGLNTEFLDSFRVVKVPSGYSNYKETIGKAKIEWCNVFLEYFAEYSDIDAIATKRIFLICDRDEASLDWLEDGVQIIGPHKSDAMNLLDTVGNRWISRRSEKVGGKDVVKEPNGKIYLLAWPRREIENYLICHKAFKKHGLLKLINNDDTPKSHHLRKDNPGDNDTLRNIDIKSEIKKIFDTEDESNIEQRREYIKDMPRKEISLDMKNMWKFFKQELQQ